MIPMLICTFIVAAVQLQMTPQLAQDQGRSHLAYFEYTPTQPEYANWNKNELSAAHESLAGLFTHKHSLSEKDDLGNWGFVHFVELRQPWQGLPVGRQLVIKIGDGYRMKTMRKETAITYRLTQNYTGKYDPFVPLYGAGRLVDARDDEWTFNIMAYVPNVFKSDAYMLKAMSAHQFVDMFATLAEGIQYMHNQHLCHRDLKPPNVLVSEVEFEHRKKYVPKIIDFGMTQTVSIPSIQLPWETIAMGKMKGSKGTVGYVAPEVAVGPLRQKVRIYGFPNEQMNYVSDWFAFGVMLWEKMFGESLIYYHDGQQVKDMIAQKKIDHLPHLHHDTHFLFDVLEACLEYDIATRFTKTRAVPRLLRDKQVEITDRNFDLYYDDAADELRKAHSMKHFEIIKDQFLADIRSDPVSLPGMPCYEANLQRANQLIANERTVAQQDFLNFDLLLFNLKDEVVGGKSYERAVADLSQDDRDFLRKRNFQAQLGEVHSEIESLFRVIAKMRPDILHGVFANIKNAQGETLVQILGVNGDLDDEHLMKAAAWLVCAGKRGEIQEHLNAVDQASDRQTMIRQYLQELYPGSADVPNLSTVTEAEAYVRFLANRGLNGQQELTTALNGKVDQVKVAIRALPGYVVHSEQDLAKPLPKLVEIYIHEAKRVLVDWFETLQRNKAFSIMVNKTNLIADIVARHGLNLPIRTKKHFLSRRGAKDIIQNKKVNLKYKGKLTDSINMFLKQVDAHDLYLLVEQHSDL